MAEENNEQKPRDNSHRRRYPRYRRPHNKTVDPSPETAALETTEGEETPVAVSEPAEQQQQPRQQQPRQQQPRQQPQQPAQQAQQRVDYSVVIPLFNEEESLRDLSEQLKVVLTRLGGRYEIIFIDDGSTDNSFRVLRDLHFKNKRIKVISFRRNYGKSAALMVGFQKAQGDFVITMDADLQDDPAEIPNLVKQLRAGFDVVSGWKKKRNDPITKTVPSKFFNFVTSMATGIKIHDFNCGLKAYRKEVTKSVNVYGELHRYIPALAHWLGFRIGEVPVQHRPRKFGKSKFGAGRLFKGGLDLLTVLFTTRYMTRPLHFFGVWGMISAMAGFFLDAYLAVEWMLGRTALSNRPLFIVGLILIIVGVQFVSLGLLGEMITKGQNSEKEYSIREVLK
ncbi:MAG: glycosyltransferase family 2 protein [Ignavibacteriales bacterium]|nr:glycosyltransferase family 2 protein [Ignavibacteriales bacterium]